MQKGGEAAERESHRALRSISRVLGGVPGFRRLLPRLHRRVPHLGWTLVDDVDGDLRMEVDARDHIGGEIFWYGGYSTHITALLGRLLTPGSVFVDVGANIGEVTLVAAKRVGDTGQVVAFEPLGEVADTLDRNVEINRLGNVTVERLALSDKAGHAPIFLKPQRGSAPTETGLGTLFPTAARTEVRANVELTTLDAYAEKAKLPRVDGMKIDAEGAELFVLRGARGTIARDRPWIIMEVSRENCAAAGYRDLDLLDFLSGSGYVFHRIAKRGRLKPIEPSDLGAFQDVLCTVPGGAPGKQA